MRIVKRIVKEKRGYNNQARRGKENFVIIEVNQETHKAMLKKKKIKCWMEKMFCIQPH